MKKKTRVIAGFPGVGKSFATTILKAMGMKVTDSDSSKFDKSEFPANYIQHIKECQKENYEIVFVSTHAEVISALVNAKIEFEVYYPEIGAKEVYLDKYRKRGNDEQFVALLDRMWDKFINGLENNKDINKIKMEADKNLFDDYLLNTL